MQQLAFMALSFSLLVGCDVSQNTEVPADPAGTAGNGSSTGGASRAGGGTASGGDSSRAGGPSTTAPRDEDFKLLFRDDFDSFDASRWQLMTHSWASNLALFSIQAAAVTDGMLTISLTPAPAGTV